MPQRIQKQVTARQRWLTEGVVPTIPAGSITSVELGGDITTAGKALLDDANASAQRTTLGLGTAATSASSDFATATHNHSATEITTGTVATARLGSGTANSTTYLRGDQTWATPAGGSTWTAIESNLSATPKFRGSFTITDAAISSTSKILIQQAPGPYTGKGTRADEAEMIKIKCIAYPGTGQCTVKWETEGYYSIFNRYLIGNNGNQNQITTHGAAYGDSLSPIPKRIGKVRGNIKFIYQVN